MTGELIVHNTLTGSKERLGTLRPGKINLFVCGPTVYDCPHLGHAKTYTQFDFTVRYLRYYRLHDAGRRKRDDEVDSRAAGTPREEE